MEKIMKSYKELEEDLIRAVQEENLDYVKTLINQKVDIHAWNDYALTMACRVGKQDMVEYFLDLGSDINTENSAPLRSTLTKRNMDLAKYLVQQGAQVNIQELKSMFSKDKVILKWLKEQEYNQTKEISNNKIIIKKKIDLVDLNENIKLENPKQSIAVLTEEKLTKESKEETKEDSFKKKLRSLL